LAKVYFAADKKRIEMQDASGDDTIIVKLAQPTASKRGAHLQAGGRGDTIILDRFGRNRWGDYTGNSPTVVTSPKLTPFWFWGQFSDPGKGRRIMALLKRCAAQF
jgi:hypothetical protein